MIAVLAIVGVMLAVVCVLVWALRSREEPPPVAFMESRKDRG